MVKYKIQFSLAGTKLAGPLDTGMGVESAGEHLVARQPTYYGQAQSNNASRDNRVGPPPARFRVGFGCNAHRARGRKTVDQAMFC